jgi:hypothetical protein
MLASALIYRSSVGCSRPRIRTPVLPEFVGSCVKGTPIGSSTAMVTHARSHSDVATPLEHFSTSPSDDK